MTGFDVPDAWRQSVLTVLEERPRTILVLGGNDTGKSSYCRFLACELVKAGQRVAIVDSDIGQKNIGPPATVTLAYATGAAEQWATAPEAYYFVGSPNPMGRMLPLVIGTSRLVSSAEAPFVIVDTTGYIEGAGRVLKGYKIDAIRPDLIVAIEEHGELESVLRPHRIYRMIRIRPSPKARSRNRGERDLARQKLFAAYFGGSKRIELGIDDVIFQRSLLFSGEPVSLAGALYAERTAEGVIAVAETPLPGVEAAKWMKRDFECGLLCGAADEHGRGIGLAILEGIDFGQRRFSLISPIPAERLRIVQFGDIYLSTNGRELGRVERAGLQ